MSENLLIAGNQDPFLWTLLRTIKGLVKYHEKTHVFRPGQHVAEDIKLENPGEVVVLLNTADDTPTQVNNWVWRKLRLNDKIIGKEMAGLPVIVLGLSQKFIETPEGKVFRDFSKHHKYLTKPLNLRQFLMALTNISPINPPSLCVVKGDAPHRLTGALEHDLGMISKKFNFDAAGGEIKKRFRRIEVDLENYSVLEKNPRKIARMAKEVKILKNEILKKRGNIWQ